MNELSSGFAEQNIRGEEAERWTFRTRLSQPSTQQLCPHEPMDAHDRSGIDAFIRPAAINIFAILSPASRQARTPRMRGEREAFLKPPNSDTGRRDLVVSTRALNGASVSPKNFAMWSDEEMPASIM